MAIEITGQPNNHIQDSVSSKQTQALPQNGVAQQTPQKQGVKPNVSPTDQVTLTDVAARLQKLEKDLSTLPVVDEQRVESLRKAIASGDYKIDPARTAEKFVQFEYALKK